MSFMLGPVSVIVNGIDLSDYVITLTIDDEVPHTGWAYPVSWSDDDVIDWDD